ncbi:MAG TPA: hypothetical protein VFX50_11345, partial [Gemmatimonadales bacterium]|nr:hypothetical protein [Gemmatimonadales bacterium]
AALAAAATALAATAGPYSDLWSDPAEPGWGVSVNQQLDTAFVTLYVHDAEGRPTWYVASDARITAYSAGGLPLFTGTLYRTRGPWHGGPFDPRAVQVVPVGEVSLELLARDRMRVHYAAEGARVVKEVGRQTFQEAYVAGTYAGKFMLRQSRPGEAPYGTLRYEGDLVVHVDSGRGFVRVDDALGRRCEYRGEYRQSGKLGTLSGTFTCTSGDPASGTFQLTDFELSEHGLSGALRTFSPTRNESGRFAAVRY